MPAKTRGWPPARRARQAALIRLRQPWRYSTGPRTIAGKAASRLNARIHGARSAPARQLDAMLSQQARFLRALNRFLLRFDRPPVILSDCEGSVFHTALHNILLAAPRFSHDKIEEYYKIIEQQEQ